MLTKTDLQQRCVCFLPGYGLSYQYLFNCRKQPQPRYRLIQEADFWRNVVCPICLPALSLAAPCFITFKTRSVMKNRQPSLDSFKSAAIDKAECRSVKGGYKYGPSNFGSYGSYIWENMDIRDYSGQASTKGNLRPNNTELRPMLR
jgi:hypothetical protein